ncbi:RNA-directed DNA polymerase, eukaryota, reverse transcriptase zinc-binding domain protein [Tanacetum coccineum]
MWIKDLCLKHNVHFLGIQESKMTRLELFRIKSMWGNYAFDYACSMARGLSGGLISIWDPNMFSKNSIWCDDSFIIIKGNWKNVVGDCFMVNIYGPQDHVSKLALWNRLTDFMHHHNGSYIMFGDMNAVRNAQERFGTTLNSIEADHFTWMNKGTKLSKLDRFLISEDVTIRLPNVRITALDRLWSDHNPILLHIDKTDFGPTPFKLYNSWLLRDGFDNLIKEDEKWLDSNLKCHEKFRRLKDKIKQWSNNIKTLERNRKTVALEEINSIEKRIDEGSAMPSDNDHRLILLQEIEKIDKFASMDIIQKAHVKWDIEGDENFKLFHGSSTQKRRNQMIQWIMVEGKIGSRNPVNLREIKEAVMGLWKKDLYDFVNLFFASCVMPNGVNSSFFTLIPKVNNPTLITDFRPISLIGIHYKIIAKILANRLSKVIDKIVSKEQSAFIAGRQILDGPVILSEIIECFDLVINVLLVNACLNSSRSFYFLLMVAYVEVSLRRGLSKEILYLFPFHLGDIPFNYLGLPIGSNMKSIASWKTLYVLGSLGIYYLSIFRAPESVLQDLERIRAKFFWGGLKAFKPCSSQIMALRFLSSPKRLWFRSSRLLMVKKSFDTMGCSFQGHLANIIWRYLVGETPLFTRYNRLYHLDQDKDFLIIDRINNGQWSWNWSRTNLGVRNLAYLCDMLNEIGQLNIDVNEDTCTWSLGPNGTFTVKDARYRIDQNILPTLAHATTWDKSIPRKVNVFMWRLSLDRLPHRLNLSSRGMDIPAISCPSCNANVESANHVFFECDIATI